MCLLSTLNTLDAIKALHQVDLHEKTHTKECLSKTLDQYLDFVCSVEAEKDGLWDIVIWLV